MTSYCSAFECLRTIKSIFDLCESGQLTGFRFESFRDINLLRVRLSCLDVVACLLFSSLIRILILSLRAQAYREVKFFKHLDIIGLSAYFRLEFNPKAKVPTYNDTLGRLNYRATRLQRWRKEKKLTDKMVLIAEVGYQSKGNFYHFLVIIFLSCFLVQIASFLLSSVHFLLTNLNILPTQFPYPISRVRTAVVRFF